MYPLGYKAFSLALVCALLPTAASAASGSHFADVPDDAWYAEAVNAMADGGLITGYTDGLFHPDDPITYGQFSMVLARVLGLETATPADAPEGTHWAQTAYDGLGYEQPDMRKPGTEKTKYTVTGYPLSTSYSMFDFNDNIYRAEVLETLVKLASEMTIYDARRHGAHGMDEIAPCDDVVVFEQISPKIWTKEDIPDWDKTWKDNVEMPDGILILLAYNLGITKGVDANGTCDFYGNVTRAQLCQLLWNMDITKKNSVTQSTWKTQCAWEIDSIHRGGCRLPNIVTGYHRETGQYIWDSQMGPYETCYVGSCTNLQFYKTYPTYESYYATKFLCDTVAPGFPACGHCPGCHAKERYKKQIQEWQTNKQAAYDEHEQWLQEFQGTRQWEIATGKI